MTHIVEVPVKNSDMERVGVLTSLKKYLDLGGDGKVTVLDFVAWQLLIVFGTLSVAALYVFTDRLIMTMQGTTTENIAPYSIPLSQVMGTLVTLVYTFAFMYPSKHVVSADVKDGMPSVYSFFDINKDGKVCATDILCCTTGVTHVAIILVNVYLFFEGHITTGDIVTVIAANSRLIIICLTNSFLVQMSDPEKKSGWRFLFDIYNENDFQLVDLLSMMCISSFIAAVTYCYRDLVFQPLGESDMPSLISLTGQMNFILISAFARVYYQSKGRMTPRVEMGLSVYASIYMILLLRTVGEMSTVGSDKVFSVITSLANKMVLGVTQLVMGSYVARDPATRKKRT